MHIDWIRHGRPLEHFSPDDGGGSGGDPDATDWKAKYDALQKAAEKDKTELGERLKSLEDSDRQRAEDAKRRAAEKDGKTKELLDLTAKERDDLAKERDSFKARIEAIEKKQAEEIEEVFKGLPEAIRDKLEIVRVDVKPDTWAALVHKEAEDAGGGPSDGDARVPHQRDGNRKRGRGKFIVPEATIDALENRLGLPVKYLPDAIVKWDDREGSSLSLPMKQFRANLNRVSGQKMTPENDPTSK